MDQFQEVINKFGMDGPKLLATTINFCIVLFVLHRFAYKPLLQLLDERRQKIETSLKEAERIKEELAKTKTERERILEQAYDEAQRLVGEAKISAGKVGEKKIQEASAQAEEIVRKAHQAAVQDREKQFSELKRQVGALVVDTTSKVVGKVITGEDEKRLQEETARAVNA